MNFSLPDIEKIHDYLQQCRANRWRAVIHIEGDRQWAEKCCEALIQRIDLASIQTVKADLQAAQRQLGSECDALLINAYEGFNPSVLGMLSACLHGGGVLILLSPGLSHWSDYADPDYSRMLSAADSEQAIEGHFLQRCAQQLQAFNHRIAITAQAITVPAIAPTQHAAEDYSEQQQAIRSIKKTALGRAHRPLVLSADRGRGKSTALGIACAQLMQEQSISIAVCAPSVHSVSVLFEHVALELGQAPGKLHYTHGDSQIDFYAVDELLADKPACRLLIIDEAAAIPTALLKVCVKHFKRLVFSTTLHGYEGNGRGFELRFLPYLETVSPQLKRIGLHAPLRWAEGDPLEAWVNQLLLLDVTLPAISSQGAYRFETLRQKQLLKDEQQLRQLLAVLLLAHYQTSPDDLRLLMDHPLLRIFVIKQGGVIIAAALLMQEGQFTTHWQQQLHQGRRCAGHILPQTLFGDGFDLLDKRFWRVLRIAVRPDLQNQGLGSRLLAWVEQQLEGDFIGASFSADASLVQFWQAADYRPCRIGSHKESSTGLYACVMLKALSKEAAAKLKQLHERFYSQLALLLLVQNQSLEGHCVIALLKNACFSLDSHTLQQAKAYSESRRGYEQSISSLHALVLYSASSMSHIHLVMLVDKLLLNHDWHIVADRYNLTGRKAVEACLRQTINELLDIVAQEKQLV